MLISFLPQLISALVALLTIRIYSEILLPLELGIIMLTIGFIALGDAIFSSATNQVIFYYSNKSRYKQFILCSILKLKKDYFLYSYMIIFAVFIIFIKYKQFDLIYYSVFLLVLLLYLYITPLKSSLLALLNNDLSRKKYSIQIISDTLLNLIFTSSLLYIKADIFYFIIGVLLSRIISVEINYLFLKQSNKNDNEIDKRISLTDFINHFKPISIMGVVGWISMFADRYIIAYVLGVVSSGIYSIATGLVGRPYNVYSAAFTAHFRPSFYSQYSSNNSEAFKKSKNWWLLSSSLVGVTTVLLFYFFSDLIVNLLLAEEYRDNVKKLLWVLSIAFTFTILTHVIDNEFLAKGEGEKLLKLQLFMLPLNFTFIFIGGYVWAIKGILIGKIISEIIKLVFSTYYLNKVKK